MEDEYLDTYMEDMLSGATYWEVYPEGDIYDGTDISDQDFYADYPEDDYDYDCEAE